MYLPFPRLSALAACDEHALDLLLSRRVDSLDANWGGPTALRDSRSLVDSWGQRQLLSPTSPTRVIMAVLLSVIHTAVVLSSIVIFALLAVLIDTYHFVWWFRRIQCLWIGLWARGGLLIHSFWLLLLRWWWSATGYSMFMVKYLSFWDALRV